MTQERASAQTRVRELSAQTQLLNSYYAILGLHPSASPLEIRRAYRDLSKRFHPDTTLLAPELATTEFQRLNEAYGILSHPEQRALYDLKIGYSRYNVIQAPIDPRQADAQLSKSAYLDAADRPLSAGEIFALVLVGLTLLGCLSLALLIAWLRGEPLLA